jgi:hypothetical protein
MQTPAGPTDPSLLERTQHILRVHDSRSIAGSLGKFILGAIWCVIAGVIFASLICLLLWMIGVGSVIGWFGWLGIAALIIAGLIWQAARSEPGEILQGVSDHVDFDPSSRGEHEMNMSRVHVAVIGDFAMWGPRNVVEGFSGIISRPTAARTAFFARAATMLLDLARAGSGVQVRALMHPPENMKAFTKAIDWLDKHDYIGKSSDGTKLWITTLGKKRLADHGIRVGLGM